MNDEGGMVDATDLVPLGAVLQRVDDLADDAVDQAATEVVSRAVKGPVAALDAERSVLGAALLDTVALEAALLEGLAPEHFHRPAHALLWRTILRLRSRGEAIDSLTVVDELQREGQIDAVGGAAAVARFEATVISTAPTAAHARLVREKATLRSIITAATSMVGQAMRGKQPPAQIVRDCGRELERIQVPAGTGFRNELQRAHQDLDAFTAPARKWSKPLGSRTLYELVQQPRRGIDWLIRGLVARSSVAMIAAEAKGTKTWVGAELMIALASGTPAFGEFQVPSRGRTLAVFLEDGDSNLQSRAEALVNGRRSPRDVLDRIHFDCRCSIDLTRPEDVAGVIASARSLPEPPSLIYIDPLRDAHSAKEDKSDEMTPVMAALRAIRTITGATVMVPHHMGKPSKDKAGGRLAHRMRGSGAIHGALDAGIYLETKSRHSGDRGATWHSLVDVELRDGIGAGMFGLSLDIVTEDGSAKVAGWAYVRDPDDLPSKAEDTLAAGSARMVRLVRERWITAQRKGQEPAPLSSAAAAEELGCGKATAARWLRDLVAKGLVQGSPRGVVYLPQEDDDQE